MNKQLDGYNIVVLTNGFVYVGDVTVADSLVQIANARNIRRWGTDKGLGQLALKGPTSETILDDAGLVIAPYHSLVHVITVHHKWK